MDIKHKEYYSIGKASKILGVKEHVLRFWEKEFEELAPRRKKSETSKKQPRREYTIEDIQIVQRIKQLLYIEEFTIKGAQKQLSIELNELEQNHDQLTPIEDEKQMNTIEHKHYESQLRFNDMESESSTGHHQQSLNLSSNERGDIIAQLKEIVQALK